MKNFLLATAVAFAAAAPAQAADIPVKAPPAVAAVVYSWTGIYVGAHGGWAHSRYRQHWVFDVTGVPGTTGTTANPSRSSGTFGGHFGAMYQINQFVVGFEAALNAISPRDWTGLVPTNGSAATDQLRMGHILTIGPRVGWTPRDRWLLTAGGGFATARVTQRVFDAAGAIQSVFATGERHNGWYAGGGIDYAVTQNIIAGVEYQHIGLNDVQHCREGRKVSGTCLALGDSTTTRIRPNVDMIRVRLTVKTDPR